MTALSYQHIIDERNSHRDRADAAEKALAKAEARDETVRLRVTLKHILELSTPEAAGDYLDDDEVSELLQSIADTAREALEPRA